MYSIVLLAAISAGENTPDSGWRKHHGTYTYGACYGGCYGVGYDGYEGYHWNGGWGLPYGGYGPAGYGGHGPGGHGGYGPPGYACFGCCGCYSSPAYGFPAPVIGGPSGPTEAPKNGEPLKKDEDRAAAQSRARLIVELPAGAKLYVDDAPISDAGTQKSFRTPVLEKDQDFFYEIRAEVIRDGKPVSETRRVIVKSGEVIRTDFRSLGEATGVASAKRR
jgi:uncharacterized protein (TIGR03000 family)